MSNVIKYDLVCVGGGIMSLTLALMTKILDSSKKIAILERLDDVALESTGAWNNAGTGHSAFCELNYTAEDENGNIKMDKAVKVCKQFEISRQFWSYLFEHKLTDTTPSSFINAVPHHSWVTGEKNVAFLQKRYKEMVNNGLFEGMEYTDDKNIMEEWFPLIMKNRSEDAVMAATRMEDGTEVNFGALAKMLRDILRKKYDVEVQYRNEVLDIDPDETIDWTVEVKNLENNETYHLDAEHVFIGAGGGALPLLQKVEIDERDGYGGFPVSGQWLVCTNDDIKERHFAKVYSMAEVGAPPMSVPHLDTRVIDGKRELLFGPFAGFSTKFLKEGSYMDLPMSINFSNIPSLWGAFWHNIPLTAYLIQQVLMSHEDRVESLRVFMKDAKLEDWKLLNAGQRVQIIKRDEEKGGTLEFGTEVVSSSDGKITALLGASPGASTAVYVMLEVLEKAFPEVLQSTEGKATLTEMIPMWGKDPMQNIELLKEQRARTKATLQLDDTKLGEM